MISHTARRQAFRSILQGDSCLHPASVAEPMAMRAAQAIGFECAMLAGSVASITVLAAPDLAVLTLSELVEQSRRICRAGDLPLMVDGDHGYGNALSVRRMVEELEAAGVAAVTIEDTLLPAPYRGQGGPLIETSELAGKVRAALDARTDAAFVVVGRTNVAQAKDRQDLLDRQAAVEDAGADALFLVGLRKLDDLDALAARARIPLVIGTAIADVSTAELAARKVRICLQGHKANAEAVAAYYRRLYLQRHGTEPPPMEPVDLVKQLTRAEDYAAWGRDYLG